MRRTFALFIAVSATLVASCGFHLRGSADLPVALKSLQLNCEDTGQGLCQQLETRLTRAGAELRDDAPYRLRVSDYKVDKRTTAVSNQAVATEYLLTTSAAVTLSDNRGNVFLANEGVRASASFRNDAGQVIGSAREENDLTRELNNQLGQQIVSRLSPWTEARLDAVRSQTKSTP